MAIPSARLIQDQNIGARFTGGPIYGEKTDGNRAQKKGGLGRKALNDISNSRKASAFQVAKKQNSSNVITVDRDTGAAPTKTLFGAGGKFYGSKLTRKGQSGGRKALIDLTNSGKPLLQKIVKSSCQGKKLTVLQEEIDIEKEGFLHNHQECVKTKKTMMDKDCFLKLVGLDDGPSFLPPSSKLKSPTKLLEMEEIPVPSLGEDQVPKGGKVEYPGLYSHACLSPVSPRLSSAQWNSLYEDSSLDFTIIGSPKHQKAGLIL